MECLEQPGLTVKARECVVRRVYLVDAEKQRDGLGDRTKVGSGVFIYKNRIPCSFVGKRSMQVDGVAKDKYIFSSCPDEVNGYYGNEYYFFDADDTVYELFESERWIKVLQCVRYHVYLVDPGEQKNVIGFNLSEGVKLYGDRIPCLFVGARNGVYYFSPCQDEAVGYHETGRVMLKEYDTVADSYYS